MQESTTHQRTTAGPLVKYINCLPGSRDWKGSILFLTRQPKNVKQPPTLLLDIGKESAQIAPVLLDSVMNWNFWRFNVTLELEDESRAVKYAVEWNGDRFEATFWIPGFGHPMHWGYTSCNGMSSDVPDDSYVRRDPTFLWRDLLGVHSAFPFHCLVGGGDQVYNDEVWKKPTLKAWGEQTEKDKIASSWTTVHEHEATDFYLNNYIDSFTMKDVCTAYASIPSVMMYDDHDIFDGYGSYAPELQNCPVFQGLFSVARRFYLLFQQHTTDAYEAEVDEFLNNTQGYHSLKYLGPQVALFCIDMRTQRTKELILPSHTYDLLEKTCMGLPDTVKHLVVLSGVPVVFPKVPGAESILGGLLNFTKASALARKITKKVGILDRFDQPEILDDLVDGWVAAVHKEERIRLIRMLQEIALAKNVRVSILSGDAHVAGVGRLYSRPKQLPEHDPLFMVQIISSAIMNMPPPFNVVKMLMKTNIAQNVDKRTRSKMVRAYWPYHPRTDKLLALRNWCDISMNIPPDSPPMNPEDPEYGGLRFVIRSEHPKRRLPCAEETFVIQVPRAPPRVAVTAHVEAYPVPEGGVVASVSKASGQGAKKGVVEQYCGPLLHRVDGDDEVEEEERPATRAAVSSHPVG